MADQIHRTNLHKLISQLHGLYDRSVVLLMLFLIISIQCNAQVFLKHSYAVKDMLSAGFGEGTEISIANEYIKLYVETSSEDGIGTFTLETTDGKDLLYTGSLGIGNNAWSSFLTIKIDNNCYVSSGWGQENAETLNNYVAEGPSIEGNSIYVKWFVGGIELIQKITLIEKNAEFRVIVKNIDSEKHNIAIRFLFDTQVDDQDGSPFWIEGMGTIRNELEINNPSFTIVNTYDNIPPSFSGIFTIVTPPSKIIFAYWPTAFKTAYYYNVNTSKSFYNPPYKRSPFSDSALLVYYQLNEISPGEEKSAVIYYGLEIQETLDLVSVLEKFENALIASIDSDTRDLARLIELGMEIRDWNVEKQCIGIILKSLPSLIAGGGGSEMLSAISWAFKLMGWTVTTITNVFGEVQNILTGVPPEWAQNPSEHRNEIIDFLYSKFQTVKVNISGEEISVKELKERIHDLISDLKSQVASAQDNNELDTGMQRALASTISDITSSIMKKSSVLRPVLIPEENSIKVIFVGSLKSFLEKFEYLLKRKNSLPMEWVVSLAYGGYSRIKSFVLRFKVMGSPIAISTIVFIVGVALTAEGIWETFEKQEIHYTVSLEIVSATGYFFGSLIPEKYEILNSTIDLVKRGLAKKKLDNATLSGKIIDVFLNDLTSTNDIGIASVIFSNTGNSEACYALLFMGFTKPVTCPWATVPIFTEYNTGKIGANAEKTVKFAYFGPESSTDGSNIFISVILYLSDGFRILLVDSFADSFSVGLSPVTSYRLTQGIISQNQVIIENINVPNNIKELSIILSYTGSRVDLHLYDEMNRHVGYNYQTGEVEVEIPGAIISGINDTIQVIHLVNLTSHKFTVQIVGVEAADNPRFSVFISELLKCSPRIMLIPNNITCKVKRNDNLTITIMEAGYVESLRNITISFKGNISQVLELNTTLIEEIGPGHAYILSIRVKGFSGTYTGNIVFRPQNAEESKVSICIEISSLLGDLNSDGVVDYRDLAILLSNYGRRRGDTGYDPTSDLNSDGIIDYRDLAILISNYGRRE